MRQAILKSAFRHMSTFLAQIMLTVLISCFPLATQAQVLTPEIERGLAWLQAQVQADGSVLGEAGSMAERQQVGCEVRATLLAFSRSSSLPHCLTGGATRTEVLVKSGLGVPESYWQSDGGVAPDAGFGASSIVDTALALSAVNITSDRALAANAYLFAFQASAGGFPATDAGPETISATSLIGRQLALKKATLSGEQPARLAAAAAWVGSQALSIGVWPSLYDTALAHLFLVLANPDPTRDMATYEHLVAQQQADGSWEHDPFLTALVLRAAGVRSLPATVDSGFKLRVIDATTRVPLPGVSVSGGPYVATDGNGYATVFVAPTASLSVTLGKPGYETRTLNVPIAAGTLADLGEIPLQPLATTVLISGRVVNEATLQPLSGVSVAVYVDGTYSRQLSSDANGRYEGNLTKAGHYRLDYSLSGYINAYAEFDASLGESYRVDSRLKAKADVSNGGFQGTVTDAGGGLPLKSVTVYWRSNSGSTAIAYTALDGTYSLAGLVREAGELSFSLAGYLSKKASGATPGAPSTIVNVAMDKGSATTGKVTGLATDKASNLPLGGARLRLVDKATAADVLTLTAAADGRFAAADLAFKTYQFIAKADGYLDLTGEFQLSASTPAVDLSLPFQRAVGGISGRVVDKATGAPIPTAVVRLGALSVPCDATGRFAAEGLLPGMYTLEAGAERYGGIVVPVSVVGGHSTDIGNIELAATNPSTAELTGAVSSKTDGKPIAGATVSVYLTAIGSATDGSGAFQLRDVPVGQHQIRVVAPGYLPATYRMDMAAPSRYRLDAVLTPVDANAIVLAVATDAATYGAYASGKVTARFTISSGVSAQYGYLEYAVLDSAGHIVKSLPEPGSSATGAVWLHSSTAPYDMPFSTGNLPPGAYRVEVGLYDKTAGVRNDRVMLAIASANFVVTATRKITAIAVISLPNYANVGVPTAAGYRLEITNRSNVTAEFDADLQLTGPSGDPVGAVSQHIVIQPDQPFRAIDVPAGTIRFTPHGQYQAGAAFHGIDPPAVTAGAIGVMPAIRIETEKSVQPGTIPPGADHKLRIRILIKGTEQ